MAKRRRQRMKFGEETSDANIRLADENAKYAVATASRSARATGVHSCVPAFMDLLTAQGYKVRADVHARSAGLPGGSLRVAHEAVAMAAQKFARKCVRMKK